MSPFQRGKNRAESTPSPPDYLQEFLAQPADEGTSDADVRAVDEAASKRVAELARNAQFIETEEALDRNAPRPSLRD